MTRVGQRNRPMYRLTISENARDPYGRALELLGSYNPYTKELKAKEDRIKYWLDHGAGMSNTVNNLLIDKGIIKGEKLKSVKISKKRQEKQKQKEKTESEGKEAKTKEASQEEEQEQSKEKPAEEQQGQSKQEEVKKEEEKAEE